MINVTPSPIAGVLLLEPPVFRDERGFFLESFNQRALRAATGLDLHFVQDNHSRSARNVLRGLHYQLVQPQGRLVRVVAGEVFDVVADIRPGSPTFGQWAGEVLSGANHRQVWVPPGLAHGFLVLSEFADFVYKTTDYYAPEHEALHCLERPHAGHRLAVGGECAGFVGQGSGGLAVCCCCWMINRGGQVLPFAPPNALGGQKAGPDPIAGDPVARVDSTNRRLRR